MPLQLLAIDLQKAWSMQSKYFCINYITCHCMEDTQEETLED